MNLHHTSTSDLDNSDRKLTRSDAYSSVKWDVRCWKVIQAHILRFGINFVFIQSKLYVSSYFFLLKLLYKSGFCLTIYFCTHTIKIQQNHSGKGNFFCTLGLLQKKEITCYVNKDMSKIMTESGADYKLEFFSLARNQSMWTKVY